MTNKLITKDGFIPTTAKELKPGDDIDLMGERVTVVKLEDSKTGGQLILHVMGAPEGWAPAGHVAEDALINKHAYPAVEQLVEEEPTEEKPVGWKASTHTVVDTETGAEYIVTAEELRQFVERYEHLEQERKDIAEQQKEVMDEAKGRGYDVKVLRKVIALRKRDAEDIAEEGAVLEMYCTALGMPT
jgi:uncharacterized protein (UPF0335 family)